MIARWIALVLLVAATASVGVEARAQQSGVFIQVEARNTPEGAQASAQQFATFLPNVGSYSLASGWFAIAVGPFEDRSIAEDALLTLRLRGLATPDAYIELGERYGQQIWPDVLPQQVASSALPAAESGVAAPSAAPEADAPIVTAQVDVPAAAVESVEPAVVPVVVPDPDPENLSQARASERRLSRAEREELQIALQWGGYYRSAIDGAFGAGTRRSMSGWQSDNDLEPTGVLTTRQRALLLAQYNAVFDGLGMARHEAGALGLALDMPMGVLDYARTEAPFAVYEASTAFPVQALLISQRGNRATLGALYEVMQTLEIVPLEGPRKLNRNSFEITGVNDSFVSQTWVQLNDGTLKGFTLLWPLNDEERRGRVFARMRESFSRFNAVLDAAALPAADARVDLISGLRVRQPLRSGAGFFVNDDGALLTALDLVAGCTRVTLANGQALMPQAADAGIGAALLAPTVASGVAPRAIADFRTDLPAVQSEVAVAGFPYGGVLGLASLTYGRIADVQGLAGEAILRRLDLGAKPGDAGGPVLDEAGAVRGLLLPRSDTAQSLPVSVQFAVGSEALVALIRSTGQAPRVTGASAVMAPEDLTLLAGDVTVLVDCWE